MTPTLLLALAPTIRYRREGTPNALLVVQENAVTQPPRFFRAFSDNGGVALDSTTMERVLAAGFSVEPISLEREEKSWLSQNGFSVPVDGEAWIFRCLAGRIENGKCVTGGLVVMGKPSAKIPIPGDRKPSLPEGVETKEVFVGFPSGSERSPSKRERLDAVEAVAVYDALVAKEVALRSAVLVCWDQLPVRVRNLWVDLVNLIARDHQPISVVRAAFRLGGGKKGSECRVCGSSARARFGMHPVLLGLACVTAISISAAIVLAGNDLVALKKMDSDVVGATDEIMKSFIAVMNDPNSSLEQQEYARQMVERLQDQREEEGKRRKGKSGLPGGPLDDLEGTIKAVSVLAGIGAAVYFFGPPLREMASNVALEIRRRRSDRGLAGV